MMIDANKMADENTCLWSQLSGSAFKALESYSVKVKIISWNDQLQRRGKPQIFTVQRYIDAYRICSLIYINLPKYVFLIPSILYSYTCIWILINYLLFTGT